MTDPNRDITRKSSTLVVERNNVYKECVLLATERGWGETRIARQCGVSVSTACRMLRKARECGDLPPRARGNNAATWHISGADSAHTGNDSAHIGVDDGPTILPDSDTDTIDPFVFDGDGRGLILSDIHIPYHDRDSLRLAIECGRKHGANHVILDGDILDFYQASSFARTSSARSIGEELKAGRQFLQWLREAFPKARLVYKVGNHEQRLERYLQTNARELEEIEDLRLENLLRFADHGVEMVAENQFVYYGHLTIIHGHEFRRSIFNPVNPARGAYLRAHACTLVAHHHQSSMHGEPDIRGELTTCWSIGCTCSLRPKYMPVNKWNTGFALLEKKGTAFSVDNKRIIDGGVW